MLNSVQASVVDPSSIGIERLRWRFRAGLTGGWKRRCNGRAARFIPGDRESEIRMPVLFVARSAKLARWASDVGFGKHVYKVGVSDEDPKALAAAGWAGETDWKIVRREEVEGLSEAEALERLARKEKPIDPKLYPKLKGASGVFRVARRACREPHHRRRAPWPATATGST